MNNHIKDCIGVLLICLGATLEMRYYSFVVGFSPSFQDSSEGDDCGRAVWSHMPWADLAIEEMEEVEGMGAGFLRFAVQKATCKARGNRHCASARLGGNAEVTIWPPVR